jgi:hypothetical protein
LASKDASSNSSLLDSFLLEKKMTTQTEDVMRYRRDAMCEVDRKECDALRKLGWEYKCDVPGSYWLWQKKLPDGRLVLVNQSMALSLEEAMTEPTDEDDDDDDGGPW